MSKTPTTEATESPAVTENTATLKTIEELFEQCRGFEPTHNIIQARKLEKRVARLVSQIGKSSPLSSDHAEALALHEYVLLSLSRTSKRKGTSQTLKNAAYAQGAASVTVKLGLDKPEIGTVFACYNLAIDLIVTENRSQEGLDWMLKADALLTKLAGKKKLPRSILEFKLFDIRYGIAKALYDLGDKKRAKTIMKRSLASAPSLKGAKWNQLRELARCSELLAQIYLDELTAQRA